MVPTATPNATFTPTPSPTPTATPTPAPTQTGGGGQIAYYGTCMRPDGMGFMNAICGLNVSGGDTFYLTGGVDPALASGNRVAVVVNSGSGQFASGGVYVFDSDDQGSTSTVVTSSGTYAEPAWSPDESKLAYAYRPNGSNTKYVVRTVNLNGTGVQTLTATTVNSRAPHWSAASGKIVYTADEGGDNEIWAMNADGSGKVQLTANSADDRDPRWSPDGTQIVFASNRDGNDEIYRMIADGSNAVRLTNNPVDDREPAWSLDGASVAFASNRLNAGSATAGSTYRIYTLRASDGLNVTQAADASARHPDWGIIGPPCDPFGGCTQSQTPPEE
ncbi:MAG: PD40 domain-containing protein [Chloroflexi bacterium]|nr:PD40 domain-containing protein [Chloroflexota bacterium]